MTYCSLCDQEVKADESSQLFLIDKIITFHNKVVYSGYPSCLDLFHLHVRREREFQARQAMMAEPC